MKKIFTALALLTGVIVIGTVSAAPNPATTQPQNQPAEQVEAARPAETPPTSLEPAPAVTQPPVERAPAVQAPAPAAELPVAEVQPAVPTTFPDLPNCSLAVAIGEYCNTIDPAWHNLKAKMVAHKGNEYQVTVAQADNPQVIILPDGVLLTFKDGS